MCRNHHCLGSQISSSHSKHDWPVISYHDQLKPSCFVYLPPCPLSCRMVRMSLQHSSLLPSSMKQTTLNGRRTGRHNAGKISSRAGMEGSWCSHEWCLLHSMAHLVSSCRRQALPNMVRGTRKSAATGSKLTASSSQLRRLAAGQAKATAAAAPAAECCSSGSQAPPKQQAPAGAQASAPQEVTLGRIRWSSRCVL